MLRLPAHKTHVDKESIAIYLTSCISHHFVDLRCRNSRMFTARQSELHEQVHGHMRVDTFMQRE